MAQSGKMSIPSISRTQFANVTASRLGWILNDTLIDCDTPEEVIIVVNPFGTSAIISWDIPLEGLPPAYEYAVTNAAIPPASGILFHSADTTVTGLTPNTQYYLHVRANCGSSTSPWVTEPFFTAIMPPPVNDDVAGAIDLPVFPNGCEQQTLGSTLMATESPTLPLPTCGYPTGVDDDIWYKFTPLPGQVFVTVEFEFVSGDIFGPAAQIYTSSNNKADGVFSLYSCSNDEGPGDMPGFYSMPVVPGTTYFVRVFTNLRGVDEQFKICVKKALLINDNADGAIELNLDENCNGASFTNKGATQSVAEPSPSCSSLQGYSTVWYKFKRPGAERCG
jgi:hypothetical protein